MGLLEAMEQSGLARFVQESTWGYPLILSSHAIGMAILVGLVLMIDLRVLGFAPAIPIPPLRTMLKIALWGLAINVISGSMLFVADAQGFYESTPFRIKMILLATGVVLIVPLWRRTLAPSERETGSFAADRVIAAVSVLVWIGVIVAGRLIAYLKLY